jgi:hypothetical protein
MTQTTPPAQYRGQILSGLIYRCFAVRLGKWYRGARTSTQDKPLLVIDDVPGGGCGRERNNLRWDPVLENPDTALATDCVLQNQTGPTGTQNVRNSGNVH